ncbi:DUF7537 family lipoprotein [Halorientalis pallida]|uniref:Uncharacterized protein n=1 Tax=Halorientalis pallida TaxID=2479928 RepID=A0A498KUW0_9EURY|nr:hypothetical protein [Halorientalis pallida]RXK48680.1 hypothetical protein EAF64_13490 [Halorientalis pallida]
MKKRLAALIGLSILIALAGCGGTTSPQSSINSPSERAENGTDQTRVVYDGVQLPNGTTATHINETQVLATQQNLLEKQDYRIGINLTHAMAGRIANTTTIIASNRSQQQLHVQSNLPGRSLREYYTANRSLSRIKIGNETSVSEDTVDSFRVVHEREARPRGLLTDLLTAAEFSATSTKTIDGHNAVIYNVTGVSGANSSRFPPIMKKFSGSMTIDNRGLIHNATLSTLGVRNGTVEAMFQEYRTLNYRGVRVEQPDWVQNQTAD